jgi:hypothetical protein
MRLFQCYDFKGMIDYIFYSRQLLRTVGLLGPLDSDWIKSNRIVGFPHPHVPSDHLPLMVELELVSNSNNSSSDSASSSNQENNANQNENNSQIDTSAKTNKPLPPIPPLKPRTSVPVANSNKIAPTGSDQPSQPNIFVKLRPVNTNNANTTTNGSSETASTSDDKPNRLDKEKRSSVKEVVQMFSEESKVNFFFIRFCFERFNITIIYLRHKKTKDSKSFN